MVYVAATPVSDPAGVADGTELAEVRWAGLAEAAELMGDMSDAVRRHLIRSLDGKTTSASEVRASRVVRPAWPPGRTPVE
jgi:hypothetical protein